MLSRRKLVWGLGGCALLASPLVAVAQQRVTLTSELWVSWLNEWQAMQDQARRRGWEVVRLDIDPPATETEIRRVETRHGLTVPTQLREVLLRRSAEVNFGWTIPPLLRPLEGLDLPTSGGLRDRLWSLDHIDQKAITAFNRMRKDIADLGDGEEPNAPETWANQFPFAVIGQGDILTIDTSSRNGPQPVRYFGNDRDGLHQHVIAPDFFSFMTAYSQLGCAGCDHDDWFRFIASNEGSRRYLDPDSEGGRRWRDWLARDPKLRDPDEPPAPVPARTKSDFNLLDAARDGSKWGVEAALAAGAAVDCVDGNMPNRQGTYSISYETALICAIRRGDLGEVERLLDAGASIDTRLLSVSEAVRTSTVEMVQWVLSRGARANRWKGDRYAPLHALLVLSAEQRPGGKASIMPMLHALLGAGADPNARFDGERTLLMWCGPDVIKVLLAHGADPTLTDHSGKTALHYTRSVETIRLLAAHGADVNALTRPPDRDSHRAAPHTPYQAQLQAAPPQVQMQRISAGGADPLDAILAALVEAGADAGKRDGWGRSALWYCRSVAEASRHVSLGFDPGERGDDGATLLHGLIRLHPAGFAHTASAVELFKYFQGLGLDINAADRNGSTVLHLAAPYAGREDIALLLTLGADKTLRDNGGRLPLDRVSKSNLDARDLLRG